MPDEYDSFLIWKLSAQQQIDDYREEVKVLKAENVKLKQELEAVGTAAYLYGRNDLADENAKLRELAGILCFCMQFNRDCDDCKLNGAEGKLNIEACEGLRTLLQDVGIEVPE